MRLLFATFLLLSAVAQAEPAFVGLLRTRETGELYAVVPSSGAASRWVKIGDEIEGFLIVEYRDSDKVLALRKDGRTIFVRLQDSRILEGRQAAAEAKAVDVARSLVVRMEKWASGVGYTAAKGADGYWHVIAMKVVDDKTQVRRVRVTPDGKPANYQSLTVEPVR